MIFLSDGRVSLQCTDRFSTHMNALAFGALDESLCKLAEFVVCLGESDYQYAAPGGGGSIGAHVRHSLDHIRLFLIGIDNGIIDYDHRERGTDIERCRSTAYDAIAALRNRIATLSDRSLDQDVLVRVMFSGSGAAMETRSTVGRELMFVMSHTIHHNAMIASAARRLGATVPTDFEYAPSTIAHRNKKQCVPSPS